MLLQEFGYGLYDGITGLVTQPIRGARKEGVTGALKGFGKGLGGVILKPSAGMNSELSLCMLTLLAVTNQCNSRLWRPRLRLQRHLQGAAKAPWRQRAGLHRRRPCRAGLRGLEDVISGTASRCGEPMASAAR